MSEVLRYCQGENLCNDREELEIDGMSPCSSLIATSGAKEESRKLLRTKSYDMKIAKTKIIVRV